MLNIRNPQQQVSISHPLVRDAYLKKDFSVNNRQEDVLVLETYDHHEETEFAGLDSYMLDLLIDLQSLKDQAERKVGHIDRVDIRRH